MSPEMKVSIVLIDADEKIAIYRKKINIKLSIRNASSSGI